MLGKLFSVMQKRDDLPEMRLPLALVFMLSTALFSCAGAKLLTSSADGTSLAGLAASLAFVPVAVCSYAMVILLWRRYASLLTTPITAAALYFSGSSLFSAAVFLFTVLVTAYAFAVSMISRVTRFRRITSVSLSFALCLLISAIAFAGLRYSGAEDALMSLYSGVKSAISSLYFSLGSAVEEHVCSYTAREIITMLPAYAGILSLTLAYISDILAKLLFRVLDCEDVFISMSREITMPKTFALVYIASAVMFFLTSGSDFELAFVMMKSLTYVMILPCAAVGIGEVLKRPEDEYFSVNRRSTVSVIVAFFAVLLLGMRVSLVIMSVCGAFKAITKRKDKSEL